MTAEGMKRFHTFIFDLGGVINDHDNDKLLATLLSKCDKRCSTQKLMQKFCEDRYATGQSSVIEFFAMAKRDFGYRGDWQTFSEDWCCHLSMREGMLAYLEGLSRSARVVFLSNTNLLHWNRLLKLSDFELARYEAFLSFDMGLAKPSKAIFEKMLLEADIDPEGALFVDDRRENVDQAKACGLEAVLYEGQDGFKAYLGALY